MAPSHPNRRSADRLTILADALLLTAVAGALLGAIRGLAGSPAPLADSFLVTMAVSSIVGATGAWFLHRRRTGSRGALLLAGGIVVSILLVLGCEAAIIGLADTSPVFATALFSVLQIMGLVFMSVLLFAGARDLLRPGRRRFRAISVTRVAALAGIALLIAVRFLPETQTDLVAARVDAMLSLSAVAGAIAAGIADAALHARRRESDGPKPEAPGDAA